MELFKAINLIAVFQIIVFIIALARRKQLQHEQKLFSILFLVSILYCLLDRTQFFYRDFVNAHNFPHFYNSGEPFWYLHMPLLFLYIKSITTSSFKLKWIQLVHALPFLITLTYVLVNYSFKATDVKFDLLHEGGLEYIHPHKLRLFRDMLFYQNLYIIASYVLVFRYRKAMRSYVSSIYWYNVTPLYIAVSMFVLMFLIRFFVPRWYGQDIVIPIDIDLSIYAITILFIGFSQSHLFLNPPSFLTNKKIEKPDNVFKNKIVEYMNMEKPHLNPDLTIETLAEQLQCSPRKLSQVLNNELDANFFNFINTYRIEEAKIQLGNPQQQERTILEILYDVGFNNKSAFNRVFKEYTHLTPTQYRKSVLNE